MPLRIDPTDPSAQPSSRRGEGPTRGQLAAILGVLVLVVGLVWLIVQVGGLPEAPPTGGSVDPRFSGPGVTAPTAPPPPIQTSPAPAAGAAPAVVPASATGGGSGAAGNAPPPPPIATSPPSGR